EIYLPGVAAVAQIYTPTWIKTSERMPESGMFVLVDIGKKYPIRAEFVNQFENESINDDWFEYCVSDDTYYQPKGWYESNTYDENSWFVNDEVLAWMPLPECSK
ncbi:MAG: DUF551 domain-containing protein, partial [Rhodoferax sp.]